MVVSAPGPHRGEGRDAGPLTDLLLSLPAAVAYVAGPDLVFEFANDEYRRIVGGRDVIGRPLREAIPELSPERLAAVQRVARTGELLDGRESEVWLSRPGREPEQLFVDFVYQPVHDESGRVDGVLLYASDVTSHVRDRRRLEALTEQLTSSEERYRTLFETLPQGVIHYDAGGSILGANPAARRLLGLAPETMSTWPLDTAAHAVHEDGSPFLRDELPVVVALRTGDVVADTVVGMPHGRTGEQRWLRVTAVPDSRDAQGRPQRAYAMFDDVTEQRRAEAALRESNRLLGRLREANVLGVAVASQAGVQDANDAYLDMVGYTRDDLGSGRISWRAISAPESGAADDDAIDQLRRTGTCRPYEKQYVHRDGHRVPALVGAAVIDWHPLRWATFVVDLTARQRAEEERASLKARESAARADAGTARERLAFLLRAGDLVAATQDPDELLERVTRLVVPTIADYCVSFMPGADGWLRATMLTHRDPASAEVLKRLREHPFPAEGPLIAQVAYATGTTRLASEFSARTPTFVGVAPEVMKIVEQVHPASALAVPLLAGRTTLGVLVMGRGEHRSRFAESDAAVMEELARRLGDGLAAAGTFAREHTVAETLQRALLPEAAPAVEGLDVAVRYLPASDGVHVGGDWYDAFPLDHHVALAIGDVAGHSIDSAAIMGQVRGLLRAYAVDDPNPPDVLWRTNAAICHMLPDALASAWFGVLDPSSGDLVYADAGHPPPLLSRDRGHAEYLDAAHGTMLGVSPEATFTSARRHLPPGAGLLLYTDGLVEDRHRDLDEGLSTLAGALRRSPGRTAEELCRVAQESLLGSAPRGDDVCILGVSVPNAAPSRPLGRHAAPHGATGLTPPAR